MRSCSSRSTSRSGSRPSTVIGPAIGRRSPSTHSIVVVLPAPFGPISPKISPSLDVERDVVDGDGAAVGLADSPDLDHRRAARHGWLAPGRYWARFVLRNCTDRAQSRRARSSRPRPKSSRRTMPRPGCGRSRRSRSCPCPSRRGSALPRSRSMPSPARRSVQRRAGRQGSIRGVHRDDAMLHLLQERDRIVAADDGVGRVVLDAEMRRVDAAR